MPNNALSLLKEDHKKVKGLLEKLSSTTDRAVKTREHLLEQIHEEIKAHMHIEEEIFYPAYRKAISSREGDKLYYEAKEEHRAADKVLSDLLRADPATLAFGGKVKVLKELVLHHAEEEEKEMFENARKAMSAPELRELGERMQARKLELKEGRAWERSSGRSAAE
jgi:hypothetical protein